MVIAHDTSLWHPTPSLDDLDVTRRIAALDHIVGGHGRSYCFKEGGLVSPPYAAVARA